MAELTAAENISTLMMRQEHKKSINTYRKEREDVSNEDEQVSFIG